MADTRDCEALHEEITKVMVSQCALPSSHVTKIENALLLYVVPLVACVGHNNRIIRSPCPLSLLCVTLHTYHTVSRSAPQHALVVFARMPNHT